MTKADLRRLYRQRRRALPDTDWQARCEAIERNFFGWFEKQDLRNPAVHTFLPIEKQKEVNTWPIVHRLWQDFPDVRVAASVTHPHDGTLTHYQIRLETPFTQNALGIPEPAASHSLQPSAFSLVLVPLLAFDQTGHRVGYGGGYYDRFLAQCRPECLKIGLSLFEPVEQIADVFAGDVPLNGCITPTQVWKF